MPIRFLLLGLLFMTAMTDSAAAQNNRILDIEDTGNGFWHVEDHTLPIVTIHFGFDGAGAVNDPEGKAGIAQLLSNTLDEGAGERDARAYQEALADHAIELSFNSSRDHFTGKMKTLKRHLPLATELLRDALTSPTFEEEAVDRMRHANIMRIKSSVSKTNWQASRLMNNVLFGDHPYADNSGGTISGLTAITPADLKQFHETYITRPRLRIATAGDLTTQEANDLVDQIFGSLPEAGETYAQIAPVTYPEQPLRKAYKSDSPQSSVEMVWPAFPKNDPDYHALRVLNHILGGGGFSSYLMEEVREKQGLTYGIYSYPVFYDAADFMSISSNASPENIAAMKASVKSILDNLKSNPIDQVRLAEAKSYLIGALPLRFSTTLSLSGTALRMQLDGRDINALDEWNDKIQAVTAEDVQRVANRVFKSTEPVVTIIAGAVPEDLGYEIIDTLPGVNNG